MSGVEVRYGEVRSTAHCRLYTASLLILRRRITCRSIVLDTNVDCFTV